MSNNQVTVGRPSLFLDGWKRTEVCSYGFADLSTTTGEHVGSPEFSCFGHQWRVVLYPGGDEDSRDGNVALSLRYMSDESVIINWGLSVRNADGKEVVHKTPVIHEFLGDDGGDEKLWGYRLWGYSNLCSRSTIMNALIEGMLIIEVRMKLVGASKLSTQFIPKNPILNNILKCFNDEESADVVFEVVSGNQEGENSKRAKTTTAFYAHRMVLKDGAPLLAELCKPSAGGESVANATVSITDVEPDIFRHMLYYVYGGKLTDELLEDNAKDIIDACDKYGVVGMKLEAEACYVKSTTITLENMIDNLLYADSKNCALLKEAVMDYIVDNVNDIIGKVSFDDVPGYMMADLLTAMTRKNNSASNVESTGDQFTTMRVSELRKKLDEKGLDVDGSREAMIATLKENL